MTPFRRAVAAVAGASLAAGLLVAGAMGLTVGTGAVAAPEAVAAAALPAGFTLRDAPSGQAAYDLTNFDYLPDGSVISTGKGGDVAVVAPDGSSRRSPGSR